MVIFNSYVKLPEVMLVYNLQYMQVSKVMEVTPAIIQVMDDHDSDLKQPW